MAACTDRPVTDRTTVSRRARLRAARLAVSAVERRRAAGRVADLVRDAELVGPGDLVGVHLPDDGELDPTPLIAVVVDLGALPALPVTQSAGSMTFRTWRPGEELVAGRFGIPVPVRGATVAPLALDVAFVPCVGFDAAGHRLGRGAGYYDRAFDGRSDGPAPPLLVGLGYDAQLVGPLVAAAHDVALDVVVTPGGVRRTRRPMVAGGRVPRQD